MIWVKKFCFFLIYFENNNFLLVHQSYFATVGGNKEKLKAAVDQNGPSAPSRPETVHERFGTKTDKGKVIFVYRNGDKHDAGTRMVIHEKKYKKIDQVILFFIFY